MNSAGIEDLERHDAFTVTIECSQWYKQLAEATPPNQDFRQTDIEGARSKGLKTNELVDRFQHWRTPALLRLTQRLCNRPFTKPFSHNIHRFSITLNDVGQVLERAMLLCQDTEHLERLGFVAHSPLFFPSTCATECVSAGFALGGQDPQLVDGVLQRGAGRGVTARADGLGQRRKGR